MKRNLYQQGVVLFWARQCSKRLAGGITGPGRSLMSTIVVSVAAVGCADPKIDADTTWIRRQLDTAVVGCKTDDRQWTLRCVDSRWQSNNNNNNNRNVSCLPGQSFSSFLHWRQSMRSGGSALGPRVGAQAPQIVTRPLKFSRPPDCG